jgi:hypothetical protein
LLAARKLYDTEPSRNPLAAHAKFKAQNVGGTFACPVISRGADADLSVKDTCKRHKHSRILPARVLFVLGLCFAVSTWAEIPSITSLCYGVRPLVLSVCVLV